MSEITFAIRMAVVVLVMASASLALGLLGHGGDIRPLD